MTLPTERYRSLIRTEKFLRDILWGEYKNRPNEIIAEARACIHHYPGRYNFEILANKVPEILEIPKDIKYDR